MGISYHRMRKLLAEKEMSEAQLRKAADIAPNTMTKLKRNEPVNLSILCRICEVLECDFGDLMEYIPQPAKEIFSEQNAAEFVQEDLQSAADESQPNVLSQTEMQLDEMEKMLTALLGEISDSRDISQ